MNARVRRTGWISLAALFLAGCAAPPLKLYTLTQGALSADTQPLPRWTTVIEVEHLILPNAVDSDDIVLSDGDVTKRSPMGRWASPLSVLATSLVTSRLAMRAPHALVTDHRPAEVPDNQITIDVTRLQVSSTGVALLDASWQVLGHVPKRQPILGRTRIRLAGPTATNDDIARLETGLFDRLADKIPIPGTPAGNGDRRTGRPARTTTPAQSDWGPSFHHKSPQGDSEGAHGFAPTRSLSAQRFPLQKHSIRSSRIAPSAE